MKTDLLKSPLIKPIAFVLFAIIGFIVFNLTVNGISAVKKLFDDKPAQEQTLETISES